uniref:Kinesin light chain n=1 Tax=Rhipicephalus zambeziensis TaxID=60191 RepID=A0A224Z2V0_9ACAR
MPYLDFSTHKDKRQSGSGKSGSRRGSRESLDSVNYDGQPQDEQSAQQPPTNTSTPLTPSTTASSGQRSDQPPQGIKTKLFSALGFHSLSPSS